MRLFPTTCTRESKMHTMKLAEMAKFTMLLADISIGMLVVDRDRINKNYSFPLLCSNVETISGETIQTPLIPETTDTAIARYHIYKYYLSKLNMVGHLQEENGVQRVSCLKCVEDAAELVEKYIAEHK